MSDKTKDNQKDGNFSDVASAATLTIGDGNYFDVTGTTTIANLSLPPGDIEFNFNDNTETLPHDAGNLLIRPSDYGEADVIEITKYGKGISDWRITKVLYKDPANKEDE